jgi:glucosylceramidase
MCLYCKEYIARGIRVFGLSVQNEPNAAQTWDSCLYSPQEEKTFVRDFLGPELASQGLTDVALTLWDHNKERLFDRADFICSDKKADEAVGAVGFHWYSGDHFEAIELVHRKYPEKLLIFTEGCIEYSKFSADSQLKNAQMYAHEIIGSLQAGMHAFIDWNLYLNKDGGPNHVNNLCDAPIMADADTGSLKYNLSYDYIGHFSRNIHPQAWRIGMTRYTDALEVTAFKNMDGSIASVILNRTDRSFDCFIRLRENICPLHIDPQSISSLIIDKEE